MRARTGDFESSRADNDLSFENERIGRLSNEKAFDFINRKRSTTERGRDHVHLSLEKQWFINIVFHLGLQENDLREYAADFDPNWMPITTGYQANHLQRILKADVSRLSSNKPRVRVVPKSPDFSDQQGAKVGEAFLDHYDSQFDFESVREEMSWWLVTCGTAFLQREWDGKAGQEIEVFKNPMDGSILKSDELGEQEKEFLRAVDASEMVNPGALLVRPLAPFQVYMPHQFKTLDEMPWMLIEEYWSIDKIWDRYGSRVGKSVTPTDMETTADGQYWTRLSSLVNRHGLAAPAYASESSDAVRVSSLWYPPTKRVPKGMLIRATRTMILENEPHPFAAAGLRQRFPVSMSRYTNVPGRIWGMGLAEHLIGPQRDYNRSRQQIISQRDVTATPQWITPATAKLQTTRNEYGDIWTYQSGGGKPELLNPPTLAQSSVVSSQMAIEDMQIISAMSDASQGRTPEGVRSGVALRSLQERDNVTLGSTVRSIESCWQDACTAMLEFAWKHESHPKAVAIYGEMRQADISLFTGQDIRGNIQVLIDRGSMMPRSQAATQQTIMDLLGSGAMNPADPRQSKIIMRAMDIGSTDSLFQEMELDERRAKHEQILFERPNTRPGAKPVFPGVNAYDDHAIHIEEHRKFLKTDTYEMLPVARKMAFLAHIQQHEEFITQAMEMQAAMQAGPAQQGSPPAPVGEASQPGKKQPTPGTEAPSGKGAA